MDNVRQIREWFDRIVDCGHHSRMTPDVGPCILGLALIMSPGLWLRRPSEGYYLGERRQAA